MVGLRRPRLPRAVEAAATAGAAVGAQPKRGCCQVVPAPPRLRYLMPFAPWAARQHLGAVPFAHLPGSCAQLETPISLTKRSVTPLTLTVASGILPRSLRV